MLSPMQRHMKKTREEIAKKKARESLDQGNASELNAGETDYSTFEVIKASAEQDQQTLAATPSGERDEVRKGLIDRYMGHVESYLNSGQEYANPVLVLVIMWLMDLGRIGEALKLGVVAVAQKQVMPKQFNRNLAEFIADSVFDWAEQEYKNKRSFEPYFGWVFKLLDEWPVNDAIRMKYFKFYGLAAFDEGDWKKAIDMFEAAQGLEHGNLKAKVKTKLDKAREELAKLPPQDETAETDEQYEQDETEGEQTES